VDRRKNCYNCGGFKHIAKHCRNWEFVVQGRKIEYKDNHNTNNLEEEENLVVFN